MITDPDIWRTAQLLIKRHGADAPVVAAQRADELFSDGDLGGAAVRRRILLAVNELQRTKPKVGERVSQGNAMAWIRTALVRCSYSSPPLRATRRRDRRSSTPNSRRRSTVPLTPSCE